MSGRVLGKEREGGRYGMECYKGNEYMLWFRVNAFLVSRLWLLMDEECTECRNTNMLVVRGGRDIMPDMRSGNISNILLPCLEIMFT